jgi:hypothetical protein
MSKVRPLGTAFAGLGVAVSPPTDRLLATWRTFGYVSFSRGFRLPHGFTRNLVRTSGLSYGVHGSSR